LAAVLRGQSQEVHPCIFGRFVDAQRMIRTDAWKLIHYPQVGRWQLFHLAEDPYETENLADDPAQAARVAELQAKLKAWQEEVGDPLLKSQDSGA
jgi:arylsulfatase A-like enzyme